MMAETQAQDVWELLVLPDELISFRDSGGTLELHNLSPTRSVGFSIGSTSTDAVQSSPSVGAIPPRKHVVVRLRLLGPMPPERVVVRSAVLPPMLSPRALGDCLDALALDTLVLDALLDGTSTDGLSYRQRLIRCVSDASRHEPEPERTARALTAR
eukprot:CAMPEP_0183377524 /NCGR_PEP_ID=MMETSP0164_2-20130417/123254_1 /TAXON_ID=221442 /ORGANISM="Coccolithus pelagicus ssp braarudi, Strain PLY182g" /LENGTH=155 /DNA_ID=CAMNT_0025554981 /DNA_START=33 /DNA_END=497 /DNA_ORIENTATION=-